MRFVSTDLNGKRDTRKVERAPRKAKRAAREVAPLTLTGFCQVMRYLIFEPSRSRSSHRMTGPWYEPIWRINESVEKGKGTEIIPRKKGGMFHNLSLKVFIFHYWSVNDIISYKKTRKNFH